MVPCGGSGEVLSAAFQSWKEDHMRCLAATRLQCQQGLLVALCRPFTLLHAPQLPTVIAIQGSSSHGSASDNPAGASPARNVSGHTTRAARRARDRGFLKPSVGPCFHSRTWYWSLCIATVVPFPCSCNKDVIVAKNVLGSVPATMNAQRAMTTTILMHAQHKRNLANWSLFPLVFSSSRKFSRIRSQTKYQAFAVHFYRLSHTSQQTYCD